MICNGTFAFCLFFFWFCFLQQWCHGQMFLQTPHPSSQMIMRGRGWLTMGWVHLSLRRRRSLPVECLIRELYWLWLYSATSTFWTIWTDSLWQVTSAIRFQRISSARQCWLPFHPDQMHKTKTRSTNTHIRHDNALYVHNVRLY